jgi:hypothetical protein
MVSCSLDPLIDIPCGSRKPTHQKGASMSTKNSVIINPIHPEFIPRLTREFIGLYNQYGATRLAGHQVPIEQVTIPPAPPQSTASHRSNQSRYEPTPVNTPSTTA